MFVCMYVSLEGDWGGEESRGIVKSDMHSSQVSPTLKVTSASLNCSNLPITVSPCQ